MLVSVIGAQIKDCSFSFVNAFRAVGLFMKAWVNIKFCFFNYGSETKIHQPHHSFLSKTFKGKSTFVVGI